MWMGLGFALLGFGRRGCSNRVLEGVEQIFRVVVDLSLYLILMSLYFILSRCGVLDSVSLYQAPSGPHLR